MRAFLYAAVEWTATAPQIIMDVRQADFFRWRFCLLSTQMEWTPPFLRGDAVQMYGREDPQ